MDDPLSRRLELIDVIREQLLCLAETFDDTRTICPCCLHGRINNRRESRHADAIRGFIEKLDTMKMEASHEHRIPAVV